MDAQIKLNAAGNGSLVVDGMDLSHHVDGIALRSDVRGGTRLTVSFILRGTTEAEADATVAVSPDTARALAALGWTPPGGQPAPGTTEKKEG